MHQIRFWLGLHHRPHWASSQLSARRASWVLGNPTSKGSEGSKREEDREKGKK